MTFETLHGRYGQLFWSNIIKMWPKSSYFGSKQTFENFCFPSKNEHFWLHFDCTYIRKNVRSDQATPHMCQTISETYPGGITYPRTNRVDHRNTYFLLNQKFPVRGPLGA